MQDFQQPVYSQLIISKYNNFFGKSKMNFQKNFLATLWAAGVPILTVERPQTAKKALKTALKY